MALEIRIPKLGLTMTEATIARWTVAAGEKVEKDQIMLIIETDKVTYEMPAPGTGLLWPIVPAGRKAGITVLVGLLAADEAELAEMKRQYPIQSRQAASEFEDEEAGASLAAEAAVSPDSRKVRVTPAAKAIAKKHGLDLAKIAGTGPGGRITKEDVLKALEEAPAPASIAPREMEIEAGGVSAPEPAVPMEIPITGVRRVIFQNMHLSLQSQAQLTLHTEASASEMTKLRSMLNQRLKPEEVKVSYNAIIIKACAQALKAHPHLNASVDGDVIKIWPYIHIGLAVDLGHGLVVPKVRQADNKTILEISRDIEQFIKLGRDKKYMPDDLANGTFTVSNLGAWDIDHFTPIVNHPESAILGVGRIVEKPWGREGQLVLEARLALSLTFDHRIIDGATAAIFLKTIKDMIENPGLML